MLKNIFNFNLDVPTFCSEKSTVITKGFESNSEKLSLSPEIPNQCISKDILVNKLKEPSNMISAGKYDNCNVNYSEKCVKVICYTKF